MAHRFIAVAVAVALLVVSAAFGATVTSETLLGTAGSDSSEGVTVGADGSIYLTGNTPGVTFEQNVFLAKFASDGSLVWQRTWDGPQQFFPDGATDVAVASDGSVYVSGSTLGSGGDALLLKFDAEGTLLWQRTYGGSLNDSANALATAADGTVYLTGLTHTSSSDAGSLFVAKFDSLGALVWQKTYGTIDEEYEEGQGVSVGPDGTVFVAGVATRPGGTFGFDAIVLKLDASGALLWQRAFATGEIADSRGGIAVDASGAAYVAGAVQDPALDALLLKFSTDGALTWARTWGGRSGDDSADVAITAGGIVVTGNTNSFSQGIDDAYVLSVSADAKKAQANSWGDVGNDRGSAVAIAPTGEIVLAAATETPSPHVFDRASSRLARARGTLTDPAKSVVDGGGVSADAGGTASTGSMTTGYAGSFDAALVLIAP